MTYPGSVATKPNASGGGRWKGAPMLLDVNGVTLAVLQWVYDAHIQDALLTDSDGQEVLDFNVPITPDTLSMLLMIKNERLIRFGGSQYRIRTNQAGWDNSGNKVWQVHCEAMWYDLGDGDPRAVATTTNATTALNAAIAGTGWTIGAVTVANGPTFAMDPNAPLSPLAIIRSLPAAFGGEVWFDNVNQKVYLGTRGNANTGILYAHGKNLDSSQFSWDTTTLYTRLYPTGANGLTIASVNAGQKYVEDYSWYDAQGWMRRIRAATLANDAITDPNVLKSWALGRIHAMAQPTQAYAVSHAQLATDTTPGLGDTVTVWDKFLGVRAQSRIAARDVYPLEPRRNTYTLNTRLWNLAQSLGTSPQSVPGGGTAPTDSLPPADPTFPSNAVTLNVGFDGQGNRAITATITWNAVTTNSDGSTLLDLDHYEVEYQVDGGTWNPLGNTASVSVTTPPLMMNVGVAARVAAVDHAGNSSSWVSTAQQPTVGDNSPPGIPTPLTLNTTTFPLAIVAAWDGKDTSGHPIGQGAPDFNLLEVHMVSAATAPNGFGAGTGQIQPSASTLIDIQRSALGGQTIATGLNPNQPYWFTSVAVDRSNNRQPTFSTPVSGSSTPLSGSAGYIAAASIGDAQIGSLNVSKLTAGVMSAIVTVSGRIATASSGPRAEMNSTGFQGFNTAGINTIKIANDGSMTVSNYLGQTFTIDTNGNVSLAGNILAGSPLPQSAYNTNHIQNAGVEDIDPFTNGIAAWSYHANAATYNAQYTASPVNWNNTTTYGTNAVANYNGFVWWAPGGAAAGVVPGTTSAWQQISYGIGSMGQSTGTNWSIGKSDALNTPTVQALAGKRSLAIRTTDTTSGAAVSSNLVNCAPGENWHLRLDHQMIGALRSMYVRIHFYDANGNPSTVTPPAGTITNSQALTMAGALNTGNQPSVANRAYAAGSATGPVNPAGTDMAAGYIPPNNNAFRLSATLLVPANVYGFRITVYGWTGAATGTCTLLVDSALATRALDGHAFSNGVITAATIQTALSGQRITIAPGNPFSDNFAINGQVVPVITFWPSFALGTNLQPPRITTEEATTPSLRAATTSLKLSGGSVYDPASTGGGAPPNDNQIVLWARRYENEQTAATNGVVNAGVLFRILGANATTDFETSLGVFNLPGGAILNLGCFENGSGIQFASGEIRTAGYNGVYKRCHAQDFLANATGAVYSVVAPVAALPKKYAQHAIDPIEIIKGAPAHLMTPGPETEDDHPAIHYGLVAEHLPESLRHVSADGAVSIPLARIHAVTWEAVRMLIERMEAVETANQSKN